MKTEREVKTVLTLTEREIKEAIELWLDKKHDYTAFKGEINISCEVSEDHDASDFYAVVVMIDEVKE